MKDWRRWFVAFLVLIMVARCWIWWLGKPAAPMSHWDYFAEDFLFALLVVWWISDAPDGGKFCSEMRATRKAGPR
jgi:hypothetical protein